MSLMHRLLYRFSAHLRCRIITGRNGEPYLERYHLLRLPFGIHVYLHRFVASDPGRALHNHPWRAALSLVLAGGYHETRLRGRGDRTLQKRRIGAGHLNYISGRIYHRIDLPAGGEAWSLFIHSASERSWGFLDTRERCFSYSDHQTVLGRESRPDWWRHAPRPREQPDMRRIRQDESLIPAIPQDSSNPL
jgi:hypothetical protein